MNSTIKKSHNNFYIAGFLLIFALSFKIKAMQSNEKNTESTNIIDDVQHAINQSNEIFLPIKGYEGYYEIGNFGTVKSALKIVAHGKVGKRFYKERVLKSYYIQNKGYKSIKLYKNNKTKNFTIHRLIAIAFIPNPNNHPIINHIDGNPLNNKIENLEWCTYKHNSKHMYDTLFYPPPNRKISDLDIEHILTYKDEWLSKKRNGISLMLSKKYNVCQQAITSILNGSTFKAKSR